MFVTSFKQYTISNYVKLNNKLENNTKSVLSINNMFN